MASGALRSARDTSGALLHRVGSYAGAGGVSETFERNPLIIGAIGVMTGALIAALLPLSEVENELLGETRDELWQRAEDLGEEAVQRVREAATEAAVRAVDAATGAAVESVRQLGEMGEKSVRRLSPSEASPREAGTLAGLIYRRPVLLVRRCAMNGRNGWARRISCRVHRSGARYEVVRARRGIGGVRRHWRFRRGCRARCRAGRRCLPLRRRRTSRLASVCSGRRCLGAAMTERERAYEASRREVADLDAQLQNARMSLNVDNPNAVAQFRQLLDQRDAAYRQFERNPVHAIPERGRGSITNG